MRPILEYCCCVWLFVLANAQTGAQEISKYDLEQRASHHFMNQRYVKSSTDYEILQNMFPKDARYAYCLGRSYLYSNKNLDRAAELLKYSAIRNYGDDAYFYLGQVYHNSYRFDDAALAWVTYKKTANERKQKQHDIDYWINLTQNARQSVAVSRNIHVADLKSVAYNNLQDGFQQKYKGKFIYVPEELKSETDKAKGSNFIMFLPENIENGSYLYFTSLSKNNRGGADIFRVKRINDNEFSMPEPLPNNVNSVYDDAYPFYDDQSDCLYFSSKGHTSSGGYDLFKIQYNKTNDSWGIAEKLDFPINSVRDDIQFALAADGKSFTFLTNRNTFHPEYDAITVDYPMPKEYTPIRTQDEVITCSLLMPSAITLDYTVPDKPELIASAKTEEVSLNVGSSSEKDYSQTIEEALELQEQSDSLNSTIQQLKLALQNENDYKKKQEIDATIATLEKEAIIFQKLADEKFAEAENYRKPDYQGTIVVYPVNRKDQKTTDIKVYQFDTSIESVPMVSQQTSQEEKAAAVIAVSEMTAAFSILDASPYSERNPIPDAASASGLIYHIQLGAFKNALPDDKFGGLTPVFKEKSESGIRYYVGSFSSIKDARNALEKVKAYGYSDAFLVSFFNHRKISIQEAREIEFAGYYQSW